MTSMSSMPLSAALGYCARRILDALEGGGDAGATAAATQLTPATAELLQWWFGQRARRSRLQNFHQAQREAILHTILAHELLRSDDAEILFHSACRAWPVLPEDTIAERVRSASSSARHLSAHYAAYTLRMTPGSGTRWVLQALLLWQWWNHLAAQQHTQYDVRFSDQFVILTGDRVGAERLRRALLGPRDADGRHHPECSSFLRHADLFLPPHCRAQFGAWLTARSTEAIDIATDHTADRMPHQNITDHNIHRSPSQDDDGGSLQITLIEDHATGCDTPLSLVAGLGARMIGGNGHSIRMRNNTSLARMQPGLLWLDVVTALPCQTTAVSQPMIAELTLSRALRIGAVKSLALITIDTARATRSAGHAQRGLRPVLPLTYRPQLEAALHVLRHLESGFAVLGAHHRPRMLIVCEQPWLMRAAAAFLHHIGVAKETIHIIHSAADRHAVDHPLRPANACAQVLIECRSTHRIAPDAQVCVIAPLRTRQDDGSTASWFAAGLPCLWHDPAFAEILAENRDRIATGRAPSSLLDVLAIVESSAFVDARASIAAKPKPEQFGEAAYRSLFASGLLAKISLDALPASIGDLLVASLRVNYREVDIALPTPASIRAARNTLSDLPQRILRARHAMPVRKCIYSHQGWPGHGNELHRALIELAEDDAGIAAYCLLDPLRQPLPGFKAMQQRHPHAPQHPDAMVRTAGYVYVIEFAPFMRVTQHHDNKDGMINSTKTGTLHDPSAPDDKATHHAQRHKAPTAIAAWCRYVNTLPGDRRQFREWRAVQLQAPLFWSWKRRGGSLSQLLSALADTTPIAMQRTHQRSASVSFD